jgi:hypothetical protein
VCLCRRRRARARFFLCVSPRLTSPFVSLQEDFSKFPKLTKKHLDGIEELLSGDIPRLMGKLPQQLFEKDQLQVL